MIDEDQVKQDYRENHRAAIEVHRRLDLGC